MEDIETSELENATFHFLTAINQEERRFFSLNFHSTFTGIQRISISTTKYI
jgi:hypothetical protein